jgi:hypothetical protein
MLWGRGGWDDDDEGGFYNAKAKNDEVDAGRDRATPASVRHDVDEPLAHFSPCYCTRAAKACSLSGVL